MITLLLVDDNREQRLLTCDLLQMDGYSVLTARNGLEGLDMLRAMPQPPDLIISNVMMPRLDGYQFFAEVRANAAWKTIPFMFTTALDRKARKNYAQLKEEIPYLTIPYLAEELEMMVRRRLTTVLVVDDDLDSVKLHELMLNRAGYSTIGAFNEPQALEKIQQKRPDLIISDTVMPYMSLHEFVNRVRALDPKIPIIFATVIPADHFQDLIGERDTYFYKLLPLPEFIKLVETHVARVAKLDE